MRRLAVAWLLIPLLAGCVSLSKYNARVEQVRYLGDEISSLEKALQQSEDTRGGLDRELKKAKENLARLEQEHEALRTAAAPGGAAPAPALETERQHFAAQIAELMTRLGEAHLRIRELTDELERREEGARKLPQLEAALKERERRIADLTGYLRAREAEVAGMQRQTGDLSRKRRGVEEKEEALPALRTLLQDEIASGEISIRQFRDKLIVSMKEQVLFDSGSARISRSGQKTLSRMAKVLRKIKNNQILVEGHTDAVPISQRLAGKFPTNWDLAAARATTVLKFLEKKKLDPKLLALAGYGCYLPAATNTSEKNRRLNRRIEIALIPLEDRMGGDKVAMR